MATPFSTTSSAPLRISASPAPPQCPPSELLPAAVQLSSGSKRSSRRLSVPHPSQPVPLSHPTRQEPDANVDEIMQHPLWANRGSERLSSQDMEKQYPVEYRSHRGEEPRGHKQARSAVKKDLGALFSLMIVAPFVSIGICGYALLAFVMVTIASPVLLAVSGKAALENLYLRLLLPGLNLHYRMAYSTRRCKAGSSSRSWPSSVSISRSPSSSGSSDTDEKLSPTPSIARLMAVLLVSPILSLPVALTNFVIMFFWFMSAVTESASSEGSMDDGRMMAKRVRRFWVRWLSGELSGKGQKRRRTRPSTRP